MINKIKKDFIRSSYINGVLKEFQENGVRMTGAPGSNGILYEDPTYLGFTIRFKKNESSILLNDNLDTYPTTLLWDPSDVNSAYQYLLRSNQPRRAEQIKLFRENLFKIEDHFPWFYQKITGLGEIFKIDPKENYRGKEKKITIELFESLDLRVSYIFDLYKKSVWDAKYMRWMLPENIRQFSMDIYIAEIRDFQKLDENTFQLKSFDEFTPVLKLSLEKCEFQSLQDGLPITDLSNSNSDTSFSQSVTISVGKIQEVNTFSLYKLVLDDFENSQVLHTIESASDLIKATKDKQEFVKPLDIKTNEKTKKENLLQEFEKIAKKNVKKLFLGNAFDQSKVEKTTKTLLSKFSLDDIKNAKKAITNTSIKNDGFKEKSQEKALGQIGFSAPSTSSKISQNISFNK